MADDYSFDDRDAAIDRYLETTLEDLTIDVDHEQVVGASAVKTIESVDQWYGQLLACSYESIVETPTPEAYLPATASIELLHRYYRLRLALLVRIADETAHVSNQDVTSSLLVGDYLYTAAYSTLSELQTTSLGVCFRALATTLQTIIETFTDYAGQSTWTASEYSSFIEGTVGVLGEGAAAIGATLAGADADDRARIASVGRRLATGRQLRRVLDPDVDTVFPVPSGVPERRLRDRTHQHLEGAVRTIRELAPLVDETVFEAFIERNSIGESLN